MEHRITGYDNYLFKAGRHYEIYEKLGAHLVEEEGEEGTYFAVWAPNAVSVSVVGDFNGCNPKLYTEKLAGGVKACLGFVKTPYSEYVPNTVLNIDIRTATRLPLQVIATYRRKRSDSVYNELVYKAKKIDWDNITFPKDYDYLSKSNM